MHNFTIISGRVAPAAFSRFRQGRDSFSHTLCIMFASFQRTNTAAAHASICSVGRIFNYFSRPSLLGVRNRTFSDDIFQQCQWKSVKLFLCTVLRGAKSACSFVFYQRNDCMKITVCVLGTREHTTVVSPALHIPSVHRH